MIVFAVGSTGHAGARTLVTDEVTAINIGLKACKGDDKAYRFDPPFYMWHAQLTGDQWRVWACSTMNPSICSVEVFVTKRGGKASACGRRID
jgi:hypothetical protein